MPYIDRDVLMKYAHDIKVGDWRHRCIDATIIQEIPAADVVERKHGYWKDQVGLVKCTVCGTQFCHHEIELFNYCPTCGAKIDGII